MRPPYTCVYREIWDDEDFWLLSEIGRLVYFYVLTAPIGNGLGCFKAGYAAMIEESRIEDKRFKKGFDEGLKQGLFEHDDIHRVLLIPKYFERNPPANPNGITAMSKEYIKIPDCELKSKCYHIVRYWVQTKGEGFKERFVELFKEPLSKPPGTYSPSPSPSPSVSSKEDIENPPKPLKKKKNIPLDEEWKPTDNHRQLADKHGINLEWQVDQFRDHALANNRKQADWDRSFNNWLRKSLEFTNGKNTSSPTIPDIKYDTSEI